MIKEAITAMAEMIREESSDYGEQWEYGIRLFDELQWSQRLMLLDQVATYLLTETAETLELTAVNEAAIGAIYEQIRIEVSCEIDTDKDREALEIKEPLAQWRQMILATYAERFGDQQDHEDEDFVLPKLGSSDQDAWHEIVEWLSDEILWDRDFELGEDLFDCPPDTGAAIKQQMGIDDDYYSTPAPDARSDKLAEALFDHLEALTHR